MTNQLIMSRNAKTGIVTREAYWVDGKEHREGDQPAHIERNSQTDVVTYEVYYKNGRRHRNNDKPAYITRNASP